jgi:hypothetical protein
VIRDLRIDGRITCEIEELLYKNIEATRIALDYNEHKWEKAYNDSMDFCEGKLERGLSEFNIREFAGTLNKFIRRELIRMEEYRIMIGRIKNINRLNGRALYRMGIFLNESISPLLTLSDDLFEIIECENESDLEILLKSSSDKG